MCKKSILTRPLHAVALSMAMSFSTSIYTAESDQFLLWDKDIKDSKDSFNAFANMKLNKVVKSANKGLLKTSPKKCRKLADKLMNELESNTKFRKLSKFDFQEKNSDYPVEIFPAKNVSSSEYYFSSIHNKQNVLKSVKKLARNVNI